MGLNCRRLSGKWGSRGRLLQVLRGATAHDGVQPKEAVVVEKRE